MGQWVNTNCWLILTTECSGRRPHRWPTSSGAFGRLRKQSPEKISNFPWSPLSANFRDSIAWRQAGPSIQGTGHVQGEGRQWAWNLIGGDNEGTHARVQPTSQDVRYASVLRGCSLSEIFYAFVNVFFLKYIEASYCRCDMSFSAHLPRAQVRKGRQKGSHSPQNLLDVGRDSCQCRSSIITETSLLRTCSLSFLLIAKLKKIRAGFFPLSVCFSNLQLLWP